MSSSEEYLDNLLKNLLADEGKAETEPQQEQDSPEALFASLDDASAEKDDSEDREDRYAQEERQAGMAVEEPDKAIVTDETEEMFAAVDPSLITGNAIPEDVNLNEDSLPGSAAEDNVQNIPMSDLDKVYIDDAVEENGVNDTFPESENLWAGYEEQEDAASESRRLYEETLSEEPQVEEWALEEENLQEESGDQEMFALEEDDLPEEEDWKESEPEEWALEEENLLEEPEEEDKFGLEEWALEEESLPEEFDLDKEWALEEENLPEESQIRNGIGLEDWALEEENLPEEEFLPEEEPRDGPVSEEAEESDEVGQEEDAVLSDEPEIEDEFEVGNQTLEEEILGKKPDVLEELEIDDWSLEEDSEMKESMQEESGALEDWNLEEDILTDETDQDEDFILEDWKLDEEDNPEETVTDNVRAEEESPVDALTSEDEDAEMETSNEDSIPEEPISEALTDPDLAEEEPEPAGTMSEEDIDRLLGDDFALEETGEDDEGLAELLAGIGHDEDLSEINDLLEKADKGLMEDDDMMALLGNPLEEAEENNDAFDFWGQEDIPDTGQSKIREIVPKEEEEKPSNKKEKRKKKNKKRREKNTKDEAAKEGNDMPKKQGAFGRFLEFLLEDEEDFPDKNADGADDGMLLGTLSDENRELLDELNAEDKKKTKKKEKKKKAKKDDKDSKKKAKEKKAKKPKKPKKEKKPKAEEPAVPEKKISRTKIIFVVLFCTSVAACIIVVNMFIPDYMQKQEARERYDEKQYEKVYDLLYGKDLNEEETELLQKSNIILQVRAKLQSYENYNKLGMQIEALNALIEGVERYQLFRMEAQQYGVADEVDGIYAQILAQLSGNYGISEADALNILASGDKLTYSEKLYGIINGTGIEEPETEQPKVKQDILPEEEEIIERIDNPDDSETDGSEADALESDAEGDL